MKVDRLIWQVAVFIIGALIGMWLKPAPAFAPCVMAPPQQLSYPKTKAKMQRFIKMHQEQGKGWIK